MDYNEGPFDMYQAVAMVSNPGNSPGERENCLSLILENLQPDLDGEYEFFEVEDLRGADIYSYTEVFTPKGFAVSDVTVDGRSIEESVFPWPSPERNRPYLKPAEYVEMRRESFDELVDRVLEVKEGVGESCSIKIEWS